MTRSLKLTLAFDGTDYVGWQRQSNGPSVQAAVEAAWLAVTGEDARIAGSSRTDAGVHALGMVASVDTQSRLPAKTLLRALNANLPHDIAATDVCQAFDGFHAIEHAVGKRYRYVIQDGRIPDVVARRYCWHVPQRLDDQAMRRAAQALVGRHDFASFQSSGSERKSTIRTVTDVQLERAAGPLFDALHFEIAADGFLYNMVRAIVGSLVRIGRGAHDAQWLAAALAARDRRRAGPTAPPQGLFLLRVDYPAAD
ncbi:MAG: tRNA pseudouridine(38-40) synthase TruA [Planctomycetales bacterium]|nr:tRNA pseudouridine(38-40) synthase TruA [Planctomycetales bacterium]